MEKNNICKDIEIFVAGINKGPLRSMIVNGNELSLNDTNTDVFKCVIDQAWLDMCRTLEDNKKSSIVKAREEIKNKLANELKDYFNKKTKGSTDQFDGWYGSVVEDIVSGKGKLSVGQVQKLINMAFKYLYCFKDYNENQKAYFKFCHMPLDNYTLNWYKREIDKSDVGPWSKLKDISKYMVIQNKIRDKYPDDIILEKEFVIWEEEKKKAENKELISYANKIKKYSKNSELNMLLNEFCEQLKQESKNK